MIFESNLTKAENAEENAARDRLLVARFNAGDERAFEELVAIYRARILGFVFRNIKNQADAEEITQDAFIRAYRKLRDFRGDSSFSSWIHLIANNLTINRFWYWQRRKRDFSVSIDASVSDTDCRTLAELIPADGRGAGHEMTIAEFSRVVDECTEKLDFSQRTILVLRNQKELSYEEIAEILCIGIGTVKSRIARAREALRTRIAEKYTDLANLDEIAKLLVSRTDSSCRRP